MRKGLDFPQIWRLYLELAYIQAGWHQKMHPGGKESWGLGAAPSPAAAPFSGREGRAAGLV